MSELARVVVTDLIPEPLECERRVLDGYAQVVALDIQQQSELQDQLNDADAVMIYHYLRLTREHIQRLSRCKVIVRPGVGYDNIDLAAAGEHGIPVCNVPDYGAEEVADSALGMALGLARGTHFLNSRLRRGVGAWNADQAVPLHRLRGRVFGIIGCGRIGAAAALRAKAFGFDVVFYDPPLRDGVEKSLGVRRVDSLEELLQQSHLLSLHCPLTPQTRGMIGAAELALLPAGAIVINTARGGVLDTAALVEALAQGHLSGAGIDVLESEPPSANSTVLKAWRDPTHPAHDRMILNPHAAFYCEEGIAELRTKASQEVLRGLQGMPFRNRVH
jgi:C-terminal binding protein